MFPTCYLNKGVCCKTCEHYGVCYRNCLFQTITCDTCKCKNNKNNKREGERNMKLKMRIKYFEGATPLKKIAKGNWIDVYARKDVFVPFMGQAMIPLGFALELPEGIEGHLAPRSSTMKSWGIIQTNHVGVIDDSFIGDNDEWHDPAQCTMPKHTEKFDLGGHKVTVMGTWVRKGDKVGQFRIQDVMPIVEFEEVEEFGNVDRGMEGTTGTK